RTNSATGAAYGFRVSARTILSLCQVEVRWCKVGRRISRTAASCRCRDQHSIAVLHGNAIIQAKKGSHPGMSWTQIVWDSTPGGNVEHVEQHDLTTDDVDNVLANYTAAGVSRSSGRPCVFGYIPDGRYIVVVY